MGSLVSQAQRASVEEGLQALRSGSDVLFDGSTVPLVDADKEKSACFAPWLLGQKAGQGAGRKVHDLEVFGPVATLLSYSGDSGPESAVDAVRRGGGSLVVSLYGADDARLADLAASLGDTHGRVHVVSPAVAKAHTGHGNVMPQSLHGGPGRAGGGEELGGLRGLGLYHRRSAVQASSGVVDVLVQRGARGA